ncbi:MAG: hypothetical protein IKL40_05845 [Clostridia bacterium]|nr:hypothetical protein [Clostridia bacterium]
MKKSIKITLIVIVAFVAVVLLGLAVIYLSGNKITIARCIPAENGGLYMVDDERPIILDYKKDVECEIGDRFFVIHSVAQSKCYPDRRDAVFAMKLGDGSVENIPDKVFNILFETRNDVKYNESNISFVLDNSTKALESRFAAEYMAFKGYDPLYVGPVEIEYWLGRYGNIGFAYPSVARISRPCVVCEATVADYKFVYPDPQEIEVWVDDEFITIGEAYEQGLIPEEVLGKLAELWADRENLKK